MPRRRGGVEIDRLGIDREGTPDVGAVVGIAHEHGRAALDLLASRGGQCGEKQPLAGAVERQHLARGVGGGGSAVAAPRPGCDRRAQLLRAADRRIAAVVRHGFGELCRDKCRHRLARLADRQVDGLGVSGLYAVEQTAELRERRQDCALGERRQSGLRSHGRSWDEVLAPRRSARGLSGRTAARLHRRFARAADARQCSLHSGRRGV